MLIPKEILVKATDLAPLDIHEALQNSGYFNKPSVFLESVFLGMNPGGNYVYEITYKDDDGVDVGNVYVKIERKAMSKDFKFYAEY